MRKGGESSAAQADEPGFTRRRRGRGWSYQDRDGATITDPVVRARIDALAIPPAWYDVWITPFANGHLQAVGTDTAGRRQYLYHADWLTDRGRIKYERALALGRALPRGRAMVAQDLSRPTLGRDLVLATAFRLLDRGHFRVGSAAYADRYGSYGLSTLRRDHVQRRRGTLVFSYVAKGGLGRVERIEDPDLLDTVGALLRRRAGPTWTSCWFTATATDGGASRARTSTSTSGRPCGWRPRRRTSGPGTAPCWARSPPPRSSAVIGPGSVGARGRWTVRSGMQ